MGNKIAFILNKSRAHLNIQLSIGVYIPQLTRGTTLFTILTKTRSKACCLSYLARFPVSVPRNLFPLVALAGRRLNVSACAETSYRTHNVCIILCDRQLRTIYSNVPKSAILTSTMHGFWTESLNGSLQEYGREFISEPTVHPKNRY